MLFLSCDIVGSTQYKQKQELATWQRTFLTFYREFPQKLAEVCKRETYSAQFVLWKPVGDELIFRVDVRSEHQVVDAVRIWLTAMAEYESESLKPDFLAAKGGAFLATVPGPDSESTIPLRPESESSDGDVIELNRAALKTRDTTTYLFDYFGPSIDTGFRVFSLCSERYFTLSVEVAWIFAAHADGGPANRRDALFQDVVFHGSYSLKGVWEGREYPVFAIDRHFADDINVAMRPFEGHQPVIPHQVFSLCKECCQQSNWPSAVFLPDGTTSEFHEVPQAAIQDTTGTDVDGYESPPTPVRTAPVYPLRSKQKNSTESTELIRAYMGHAGQVTRPKNHKD